MFFSCLNSLQNQLFSCDIKNMDHAKKSALFDWVKYFYNVSLIKLNKNIEYIFIYNQLLSFKPNILYANILLKGILILINDIISQCYL